MALKKLIETMRGGHALILGAAFGFPLDYTYEQFVEIEKAFMERYPHEVMPTTALFFGFILGETMVRNIAGATWANLESEDIWDMAVEVPMKGREEKMLFRTMSRAHNCALNNEDTMTTVFWMADMMSKYTMDELMLQGKHIGDGWYLFPNGEMMRMMTTSTMPEDKNKSSLKAKDLKAMVLGADGKIKEQPLESKYSPTEREKRKNWN